MWREILRYDLYGRKLQGGREMVFAYCEIMNWRVICDKGFLGLREISFGMTLYKEG